MTSTLTLVSMWMINFKRISCMTYKCPSRSTVQLETTSQNITSISRFVCINVWEFILQDSFTTWMTILFIAYFTMFLVPSFTTYCKSFFNSFSFFDKSRWLLGDFFATMWKSVAFGIGDCSFRRHVGHDDLKPQSHFIVKFLQVSGILI